MDQLRESLFSRNPVANQRLHEIIGFATKQSEAKTKRGGLLHGVPHISTQNKTGADIYKQRR